MLSTKEKFMKITKLTALVCCIAMLCICFASCDIIGGIQKSESDKYVATVTTKLATNDDKMKDALVAAGSPVTLIKVDGDNVEIESSAKINDITMNNNYVYIDGVLYHSKNLAISDKSVNSFNKAEMSADQRDLLIASVGTGADVDTSDFATVDKMESGGVETYTCRDINDDAKESLCSVFASKLSSSGATVSIEDVKYIEDHSDGRVVSSILSCSFIVAMGGEEYSVTMHINCAYDYDAEVSISAPADADKYNTVSLDEILK